MRIIASFFVIEGNIPILIGNDILEPLEGIIKTREKELVCRKLNKSVSLVKTKGGHYVVPVVENRNELYNSEEYFHTWKGTFHSSDLEYSNNVIGDEADAVMLNLLASCKSEQDEKILHTVICHTNFITLILNDDEKKRLRKFTSILVTSLDGRFMKCLQKEENLGTRKRLLWI